MLFSTVKNTVLRTIFCEPAGGQRRQGHRQGGLGGQDLQGRPAPAGGYATLHEFAQKLKTWFFLSVGEPSQDGEVRRRVQPDLPQRRLRPLEPKDQIPGQAHLRKNTICQRNIF